MKYSVPTLEVDCILRERLVVGAEVHPAGTIVKMAYGIALQGMAQRVVGAIVNAQAAHDEALMFIAKYGADSWFPQKLQTLGMATAEAEPEPAEEAKH